MNDVPPDINRPIRFFQASSYFLNEPNHVTSKTIILLIKEAHIPLSGNSILHLAVDLHEPSLKYMPLHLLISKIYLCIKKSSF